MKDNNVDVDTYMAEVRRKNGLPARRKAEVEVHPFSDDALALRFADQHAGELRYVAEWSRWVRYDGVRWQFDDTLAVFDSVRVICRAAAAECNKARTAKELASAKTVAAVERLARSDRRLAATVDQWDADLWLLNTPKGVIDLRTGAMRAHRAEDYLTHMTAVAPEGECPLWHTFLDQVTGEGQGAARISATGLRLRADRLDARARAVLPLRQRSER